MPLPRDRLQLALVEIAHAIVRDLITDHHILTIGHVHIFVCEAAIIIIVHTREVFLLVRELVDVLLELEVAVILIVSWRGHDIHIVFVVVAFAVFFDE